MSFKPRYYQQEAIDIGIDFFAHKKKYNGIEILPTGSGKSLVIACISKELKGNTLVLQPSKEILQQNFAKFLSYGCRGGVYSASANMKFIDKTTFATIGSIAKKMHLFERFQNIIIDEAHCVNPTEGQYHGLIKTLEHTRVLGLTATPYRLTSGADGAMLKFLTRTSPRIFNKVIYAVQNDVLFNAGYLAQLEYYRFNVIDRTMLSTNTAGTDFTDASLRSYYRQIDMPGQTIKYGNRILSKRRSLLIFCSIIDEAVQVSKGIPGSVVITGDTDSDVRERILKDFKNGKIRCVVNCKVLDTGFDYPELEAVLIACSTMSLAKYYQIVGRVMRPHTYEDGAKKVGWVVDLGGNFDFFGRIETMKLMVDDRGLYSIWNNGRQLTNVSFTKN
jgi:DNA repair protein RadD